MTELHVIKSGSVSQANMRISAVDGAAFVDFSAARIFTDHIGALLRTYDSLGAQIEGYIKALGAGETLGAEIDSGTLTEGALYKLTAEGEAATFPTNKAGQSVTTTYAASGSSGITVADNDNSDIGVNNFTLIFRGSKPDWSQAGVTPWLIGKAQNASNMWALWVNTTGTIHFYAAISGGTTINIGTTAAPSLTDGSVHEIACVVTRETATVAGSMLIYVDKSLFATVAIPAGTPANFNNTGNLAISGYSAIRFAATVHEVVLFNRALSGVEVAARPDDDVAEADQWGSQTALNTADLANHTVLNQDYTTFDGASPTGFHAIGDGSHLHLARMGNYFSFVSGKKYRIEFDAVLTSGSAPRYAATKLHGGAILAGTEYQRVEAGHNSYEFTAGENSAVGSASWYNLFPQTVEFTISNFKIIQTGATLDLAPIGIRLDKWWDSSDNDLDAAYPAAGCTPDVDLYFTAEGTEDCDASNKVQQVTAPVATGVTIVSAKAGTTYNWADKEIGFSYNDLSGFTFEIFYRYEDKKNALSRTPCTLAVLTLDFCSLVYGEGACTASAAAGSECYNTYPTCQDRANFSLTTKDYKFTSHAAPLPFKIGERPYIKAVKYLSTEIKDSETVKGRITVDLTDEPDTDVGIDPYVLTRASVQGTFWRKLLARNPNYKGRKIKLYDGFTGLAESDFTTDGKRFSGIIDNVRSQRGLVQIEAVDLLKQIDDVEIPAKLNVRLALDITAIATQTTLEGSDLSGLDSPTGYVRIDDEIIYYGGINATTGIISSIERAQFDTEAAAHDAGAKVQQVKYYEPDNPFDMLQTILTDAGVDSGDIYDTAFDAEKAFFADFDIEAVISEPTSAKDLYFELVNLLNCKSWVSEELQITIARILPNHPDRTYHTITDEMDIVIDSGAVDLNQKSLITRCSVFWDPEAAEAQDEQNTYRRLTIAVDAEAESTNEYNTVAEKKILSRWLRHSTPGSTEEEQDTWINSLAGRNVWQSRDPMPIVTLRVEIKNGDILTGHFLRLSTDEIQDIHGNDLSDVVFQVIRREKSGSELILKCLRLTSRRVCYVADDAAPDFSAATVAEKDINGYVCSDNGRMADFTDGYYIF